jgi:putative nucleotidyltransferase with HDIG domain
VIEASSGKSALKELMNNIVDLIILDIHMDGMDGFETAKIIKTRRKTKDIPIVFLTAKYKEDDYKDKGFEIGAVDYMTKPINPFQLLNRISIYMKMKKSKEEEQLDSIFALANSLEAKDPYTRGHCQRVMEISCEIAENMKLSNDKIKIIEHAALLHDIGKIGIAESIINKKGGLTDIEFSAIKKHPIIGFNILKDTHFFKNSIRPILEHHERYDGMGYPCNKKKDEITLEGRILAVADSYDAMTSDRTYRKRFSSNDAFKELINNKNKQFDSKIVSAFLRKHIKVM